MISAAWATITNSNTPGFIVEDSGFSDANIASELGE
jgi:hypothetical protein